MRNRAPEILGGLRPVVEPAMRAAIDTLDPLMQRIASYQMGWCDAAGEPSDAGGKAIRPALAVLGARAVGARDECAIPGAVAVELVHNFSLLHDDVMDNDIERRHRPTGWVVFGVGQAILAGNAMLTAAVDVVARDGEAGKRSLPLLLDSVQGLITGQSDDLDLEGRDGVTVEDVLKMEAGKTAVLLSCSAAIGALAAGAPDESVRRLASFGHEVGIAFQLVDDVLGVVGDPAKTGKSSSSDVRAGKRSATIVAALTGDSEASERLRAMFADGPPEAEEDVVLATKLISDSGGLDWALGEAERRMRVALEQLDGLPLVDGGDAELAAAAVRDLIEIANYIVDRDR